MASVLSKCERCSWQGSEEFFYNGLCSECRSVVTRRLDLPKTANALWQKMDRKKSIVEWRGQRMTLDAFYHARRSLRVKYVSEPFRVIKYVPKKHPGRQVRITNQRHNPRLIVAKLPPTESPGISDEPPQGE